MSKGLYQMVIAGPDHASYMLTRRDVGSQITVSRVEINHNGSFTLWPISNDAWGLPEAFEIVEKDAAAWAQTNAELRERKVSA